MLKAISRDYVIQITSFALALFGLGFLYQVSAKEVLLSVDGDVRHVKTHTRSVGDFMADIKLTVGPSDHLNVSEKTPITQAMRIELERAKEIKLAVDGKEDLILSASKSAANILADAGVRLFPGDKVWLDGLKLVEPFGRLEEPPRTIRLEKGIVFEVVVDGQVHRHRSLAPNVGHALIDAGFSIYEGDRVEPGLLATLDQGMRIEIIRARPIMIRMGPDELQVQSAAASVGEVLMDAGLTISGLDYSVPGLEDPVPSDGIVQIVLVEEDVLVELEPLPFETVYQPIETLELDAIQVLSAGTFGVQAERVRIRYEDGQEVNRSIEEAATVVEPEPRVLGYGTKIVVRTISTSYGTIEYWRAVPVYATSFSPCNLGVDRCGFVTASGTGVDRGTIGVIRSWFNQMRGWPVFVPGYGSGSIQDIGAGFSDRDWVDLGFTDEQYEAWHDWTTLYFLTPVPPLDQVPWILP